MLDDSVSVSVGETASQEITALDRKKEFVKINVPEKIRQIEVQQLQQDLALADLFELGGGL